MRAEIDSFIHESIASVKDDNRKKVVDKAIDQYKIKHANAIEQFDSIEAAKQRAAYIRWKALNNLDKYLIEFESVFQKNGGKIIWAQNAEQAINEIENIIKKFDSSLVYKTKSGVCDEIHLNHALTEKGIRCVESDTGQFIINQSNEKAEHMILPAIHKSKADVFELLQNDFDFDAKSNTANAVEFTSDLIKKETQQSHITITGANFLCADSGAICITENEGNIFYGVGKSDAHIVVTGIDKILPSISDLDLFIPLLSSFASGEQISSFNHILIGPAPGKELYLVLLDNGRTESLSDKELRPVMSCITCGACQLSCPVFKATGNKALPFDHGGPSGNLKYATKNNPADKNYLFELSTLCGKCSIACPVNINLHRMYLIGRKNYIEINNSLSTGKLNMFLWKKSISKRGAYNFASGKMRKVILETYFKPSLKHYDLILSEKSFNELWREKMMIS